MADDKNTTSTITEEEIYETLKKEFEASTEGSGYTDEEYHVWAKMTVLADQIRQKKIEIMSLSNEHFPGTFGPPVLVGSPQNIQDIAEDLYVGFAGRVSNEDGSNPREFEDISEAERIAWYEMASALHGGKI